MDFEARSMHSKDTFFIKYTIILQAYFVRVDQFLLKLLNKVKCWDLKHE